MKPLSPPTIVAGVALGIAYTWSPLMIVFAIALPYGCWVATRDLPSSERRVVGSAIAVAVAIRLLAIAALLLATDPMREQFAAFFPDAHYAIQRSWWIRNLWFGVPIGPHALFGIYDTYGASSFTYALAAVQAIVGPSPYGVDLISVAALVATAVLLFRLARRAYGFTPALAAFLVILFWPTMIAWSVSALREASQVCLVALALATTVAAVRMPAPRARITAAAAALAAVYAIGTLRSGALLIVAIAIPAALVIRAAALRASVAAAVGVAAVALAIVLASRADVRAFVEYQTDLAANRHFGQAMTSGRAYRLLDDRFYAEGPQSTFTVTRPEAARFFARAATAFVLVPMPWRAATWAEAAVVPQQLTWYALVALAIVGLTEAWRRDPLVTSLLALYVVMGVVVIAPNSGNIGTLVRHRDTIVPAVACLAGVGLSLFTANEVAATDLGVSPGGHRGPQVRRGGRFNIVDTAAVASLGLALALGIATVRVFRPIAPTIESITLATAGGGRQFSVHGRDLTDYLHLFVAPTGEPLILSNPVSHGREATWRAATTSEGRFDVPPQLETGRSYDLHIYDEGRQVTIVRAAFRVDR
jgi:hypothetical protein